MIPLFLDLETIPLGPPEFAARMAAKKPGLHPLLSRIVVIGCAVDEREVLILGPSAAEHLDAPDILEAQVLKAFWGSVTGGEWLRPGESGLPSRPQLVTYNGLRFDVPMLMLRSRLHGIKQPYRWGTNPWRNEEEGHTDLMRVLSPGDNTFISLPDAAEALGIAVPADHGTGAETALWWEAGDFERIRRKCREDVLLLRELWGRVGQR